MHKTGRLISTHNIQNSRILVGADISRPHDLRRFSIETGG